MERQAALQRSILVYGACAVVAIVIGYMMSNPLAKKNLLVLVGILGFAYSPILLKWYHPILIACWNATIVFYFLPGKPSIVFLMSVVGFGIAVLSRCMSSRFRFQSDRFMMIALALFLLTVCSTIYFTGGIGVRAMGSEVHGGKKYLFIFGAAMGYLALVSRTVSRRHARLAIGVFLLSALTAVLSYPIYLAGPAAYALFNFFPPEIMGLQGMDGGAKGGMIRWAGLSASGAAFAYFLLARFGIRGLVDWNRPWRAAGFLLAIGVSLLGGFRSLLLMIVLTFAIQFVIEGMHRTRWLAIIVGGALGLLVLTLPFVRSMPLSIQRTLSVLPIDVDPIAAADARDSTEWRLDMWKRLWPMIPQYFWTGKGYSLDPVDQYFAYEGVRRGTMRSFEPALIAGEYHNGGLSVLIGFGVFGLLAFLAVLAAGTRILLRHYRRRDSELHLINTFLLSHFVARIITFFAVYGAVSADMFVFLGLVGLGVALNGREGEEAEQSTEGNDACAASLPAVTAA